MKILSFFSLLLAVNCGTPAIKSTPTNTPAPQETNTTKPTQTQQNQTPTESNSILPKGAVFGNFNGDNTHFFAHILDVNTRREYTTIGFQNNRYPSLEISKTLGGTLSTLHLEGNDRALLLFEANLKDPNFKKYFLYVLRNNQWKPVMNGFAIHKSNKPESLTPIRINPNKPNELLRNYSVFDLDPNSTEGYVWRLLEESVVKENW